MLEETFFFNQLSALPSNEVGLAVLGFPIKHSISPQIHAAALEVLAENEPAFNNWNYRKIELSPDALSEALPVLAEYGFRGLNLTIPHKVKSLPLLSSIDQQAQAMGAVNTLSWEEGHWRGYNTDGIGLSRAIKHAFKRPIRDFDVLVLGAGGAARAAVAQCLLEGCKSMMVFNRSPERANQLCDSLRKVGIKEGICVLESLPNSYETDDSPLLVINATSLGLRVDDPAPIDLTGYKGNIFVYDMVYNPPVTQLLIDANANGFDAVNGLGMLVGQAAKSLEIWSGRVVSTDAMVRAAQNTLPN